MTSEELGNRSAWETMTDEQKDNVMNFAEGPTPFSMDGIGKMVKALRRARMAVDEPPKPPAEPHRERRRIVLEIAVDGEPHEADMIRDRIASELRPWKRLIDATGDFDRPTSIVMIRQ